MSAAAAGTGGGGRAEYHVGPGQRYANLGEVPWYGLEGGDTVYVHYRSTPYREKVLISGRGTPTRWIRILGVPGSRGERPIISGDGASTSERMRYRWPDATGPSAIQWLGVVQIAAGPDRAGRRPPVPGFIEIANLHIRDGYTEHRFTAENGASASYHPFAACLYARSVQHLVVRNNVLSNCGQGFYNWTGDGSADGWWAGVASDIVLTGNHFENNGHVGGYREHQVYTEADGVVIESNRFGPQRPGALGSQIKDRSVGTIIRYNFIEQARAGWDIDLVEPEESLPAVGTKATFKQSFVYGNVIVNRGTRNPNVIHWNEDHQTGRGRATSGESRLFFYNNTVVTVADRSELPRFNVFNVTWGGYECPKGGIGGTIDVRNNMFAVLPRTPGSAAPQLRFGYCGSERFSFGKNWVSPGWIVGAQTASGTDSLVSPLHNDPGFVDMAADDYRLNGVSSARGIGGDLAPEVVDNHLKQDLTPRYQYGQTGTDVTRPDSGRGSNPGAFGR